jgi:hypothetical protein
MKNNDKKILDRIIRSAKRIEEPEHKALLIGYVEGLAASERISRSERDEPVE